MPKLLKSLTILTLLILNTACTPLRDFPICNEFEGIKTTLDRQNTVNLFIVHGLGGYSNGDPDTLINNIVCKLDLHEKGVPCVREIVDDACGGCRRCYGVLTRRDFYGFCAPHNLRIYVLDWENATKQAKAYLRDIDCTYAHDRLSFVTKMKKSVVNSNLADAFLYISNFRSEIQYPVAQSIQWIESDRSDCANSEIIVLGYSFGSSIVIDTLDNMIGMDVSNREVAERFIQDITGVFMLSNAHPLFEIAKLSPSPRHRYSKQKSCAACVSENPHNCPTLVWDWRYSSLGRFIHKKREQLPGFQIVAFSDPNDPLTYIVDDFFIPSKCGWQNAFINEKVRNAKWALFGLVNPIDTHGGYGQNEKVLNMIIYGVQKTSSTQTEDQPVEFGN